MPEIPTKTHLPALDHNLLADLEMRDQALQRISHAAAKYRHILRLELTRLRQGADPAPIRAGLERWANVLHEVKRLARML